MLVLIFFASTLFIIPTHALASFSKNPTNPIVDVGLSGTWDTLHTTDPYVMIDGGVYKMWYSGTSALLNAGVGYATSTDGLSWTKLTSNPIFIRDTADPTELEVGKPKILKVGAEYKMWYLSTARHTGPGSEVYRIKLASSPNGIDNWVRQGFVFRRSSANWESEGVETGKILYENDEYKMWYSARDNDGIWRIGFARSQDGIAWTRNPNPVLTASQSWEGSAVAYPDVHLQNNVFHMYYHAGPIVPHYLGHATSTDGVNWTKDTEPILSRGGFGEFDRNMILSPNAIRVGNKLRLYYSGDDGTYRRIGLAEETLPLPYFSQKDPLWGADIYDNANVWANANSQTMSSLGCAVTSAAMVLKNYNVTKTPGNAATGLPVKDLNPGTLNEWMKSKNDAYFRNGAVNFALIAAMTKQVNSQDGTSPKLEYFRNDASLDTVLANYPAILKLAYPASPSNTHFVVATKKEGSTYAISDPYFQDRVTLAPSYSTILRTDHFQPTNSDFSYFVFTIDPEVSMTLKNQNGDPIGEQSLEEPFFDPVNNLPSGGESLKVLYLKQPVSETYTLQVSASASAQYTLDTYVYNQDGIGGVNNSKGIVSPTDKDTLKLSFDPQASPSASFTPEISYASVKDDFKSAYDLGMIKKQNVYTSFIKKIISSEKLYNSNKIKFAKAKLKNILKELKSKRGKSVTEEGYQLLYASLTNLLNQL